jgi:glutaconate CoA-transferase subunit A
MPAVPRSSVVRGVEEALEWVADGAIVGLGGSITAGHPMVLVRALARRGARDLVVVAPTAGLDVDLLIAAGCVRKVVTSYVGAEGVAPVGPAFRAAVESGAVEVSDLDEAHCAMGLRAAAQRLPFLPWRGGVGTSLPELTPELVPFDDPVRGERLLAVPAIELDVALIAADAADEHGNVVPFGAVHMDTLLAAAAERAVVQVQRLAPNEAVRAEPRRTLFWRSTAVVVAPMGTHPYSSPEMAADEAHLAEYAAAARAGGAELDGWLDRWVRGPATQEEYVGRLGPERIAALLLG